MRRLVVLLALLASACRSGIDCPSLAVPHAEARIYAQQEAWLAEYAERVAARSPGARSRPVFGAHLLTADSNRAGALLQPDALAWAELSLDRFAALGIRGVTLNLGYPMLLPEFPDSARYLAYYEAVTAAVRKRAMTLAVEQTVLYTRSPFTPFAFPLEDLTLERYTAEQTRMAQIVIDRLAPDYLTVLHEPDTVAERTGLAMMLDPEVATRFVNDVLAGVRPGATKLGAGSGSWSGPRFAQAFAADTKLDYVDIHIYWVNPESIDAAYAMADAARQHGKAVIFTEVGLYKSLAEGLEGSSHVDGVAAVYRRDVFSFWEPLDVEFLATTARMARTLNTAYVSAYWSNMFFSYIDWNDETAALSYEELNRRRSAVSTASAWLEGRATCAGRAYEAAAATSD